MSDRSDGWVYLPAAEFDEEAQKFWSNHDFLVDSRDDTSVTLHIEQAAGGGHDVYMDAAAKNYTFIADGGSCLGAYGPITYASVGDGEVSEIQTDLDGGPVLDLYSWTRPSVLLDRVFDLDRLAAAHKIVHGGQGERTCRVYRKGVEALKKLIKILEEE